MKLITEKVEMRILYITPYSIHDNIVSSGTVVSVKNALEKAGNNVVVIDGLPISLWQKIKKKLIRIVLKKEYDPYREPVVLKRMNKVILKRAANVEYDIVFSQTSVLCAYYTGSEPIVFYTDASFGGMLNYYADPKTWYKPNLNKACETERLALKNCSKAIYASQWAINSAIKYHEALPDKCVAINRGANIEHNYGEQDIQNAIECRNVITEDSYYKFLFVGRDWERKGGPLALEVVKILNSMGYQSKLIVVGCKPNINEADSKFIESIGFLNKANKEENIKLQSLYLYSDFYLQPSKQEAQGIAYTEASAFGLPVFAADTGGVSGVVTEENGCLMKLNDSAETYAIKIKKMIDIKDEYRKLSIGAFNFYEEKLNWSNVGMRLTIELDRLL